MSALTKEQQAIRDTATDKAIAYGFREIAGVLKAPLGKFESEPYYALYFYDAMLDGCADEPLYDGDTVAADVIIVSDDERVAFELNQDTAFVVLWYSDQGFVSLQELTASAYDELCDAYENQTDEEG